MVERVGADIRVDGLDVRLRVNVHQVGALRLATVLHHERERLQHVPRRVVADRERRVRKLLAMHDVLRGARCRRAAHRTIHDGREAPQNAAVEWVDDANGAHPFELRVVHEEVVVGYAENEVVQRTRL